MVFLRVKQALDDWRMGRMDMALDRRLDSPVVLVVCLLAPAILFILTRSNAKSPPSLSDKIPFITNTIQYLTNAGTFIDRVTVKLNDTKSKIVKFYVGLTPAYIVVGPKNVQKVLGSPHELDGNWLQLMLMAGHWDMSNDEIAKFANDNSGRGIAPAPGAEGIPAEKRYWHMHDRLYLDFLAKQKYSDALARSFNSLFVERLDHQPKDEWTTVGLLSMLKTTMAESAIISLFGSKIIELNPGFIKTYWKLDDIAGNLVWGLPKFMQRTSVAIRERMHSMTEKHINEAWEHFDWDGTDEETEWEPHFGSRLSRETAKWFRENGFSNHAAAGHTLGSLVGLNGNTVPVTTWAMIEAIRDPELFQALREEALAAYEIDPTTGENRINAQKLVKMPLMQSLYVEIMRMHVSFNPTRMAKNTVEIDGYKVKKGALVQTCSRIAHYEDAIWGTVEHPASEFWAYRNTKVIETVDESTGEVKSQLQFGMKGRPSSFFPYGGGYVICPGRHFAKQEILLAVAVIVSKFDIEFVEWTHHDGSKSDRAAEDDRRFAAFIAMHPDREMKIRWRRHS